MGSYKDSGFYKDSDPIYQEGFSIEDQKLIEYLPESSREHEVIGKWLRLMQKRKKVCFQVVMILLIICQVILNSIAKLPQ